jgi:hypothetical protein
MSMLLGLIFQLLVGAGTWSVDAWLAERRTHLMVEPPAIQSPESISEHSRPNWAFENIPTLKTLGIARL